MDVGPGKKISFEYTLTLSGGDKVIDSNTGKEPLVYEHGSNKLIPGLEKAMEGMKAGESKEVEVKPEDAYGPIMQEAIVQADINSFPEEMRKVGTKVQGKNPYGKLVWGRVAAIDEKMLSINFNHPLAGQTLFFKVKVIDVQ